MARLRPNVVQIADVHRAQRDTEHTSTWALSTALTAPGLFSSPPGLRAQARAGCRAAGGACMRPMAHGKMHLKNASPAPRSRALRAVRGVLDAPLPGSESGTGPSTGARAGRRPLVAVCCWLLLLLCCCCVLVGVGVWCLVFGVCVCVYSRPRPRARGRSCQPKPKPPMGFVEFEVF